MQRQTVSCQRAALVTCCIIALDPLSILIYRYRLYSAFSPPHLLVANVSPTFTFRPYQHLTFIVEFDTMRLIYTLFSLVLATEASKQPRSGDNQSDRGNNRARTVGDDDDDEPQAMTTTTSVGSEHPHDDDEFDQVAPVPVEDALSPVGVVSSSGAVDVSELGDTSVSVIATTAVPIAPNPRAVGYGDDVRVRSAWIQTLMASIQRVLSAAKMVDAPAFRLGPGPIRERLRESVCVLAQLTPSIHSFSLTFRDTVARTVAGSRAYKALALEAERAKEKDINAVAGDSFTMSIVIIPSC